MKNMPKISMYQPLSSLDVKNALARYFHDELGHILYLRLSMASAAVELPAPPKNLKKGISQILKKGRDVLIISIGPVILGECLKAAQELENGGISIEVWNHPWLIDFD